MSSYINATTFLSKFGYNVHQFTNDELVDLGKFLKKNFSSAETIMIENIPAWKKDCLAQYFAWGKTYEELIEMNVGIWLLNMTIQKASDFMKNKQKSKIYNYKKLIQRYTNF